MTIKKDATICVLKVWIRNFKKWKLELIYVFAYKMCGYRQFLWVCNWPWCCIWSIAPSLYLQASGWSFSQVVKDKCHGFKYFQSFHVAHRQFKFLEVVNSFTLWQRSLSHFTHYNHHILTQLFILKYFCIKLFFKSIKLISFSSLTRLGSLTLGVYYSRANFQLNHFHVIVIDSWSINKFSNVMIGFWKIWEK